MKKLLNLSSKAKLAAVGAVVAVTSSPMFAAVVYDSTSGALTGSIEMNGYNSALTIIIPAIVTIAVGGIILRTIKKI